VVWSARVAAAEHLRRLSDAIVAAQRPIRILKAINWDPRVHEQFFKAGACDQPRPEYPIGSTPRSPTR